MAYYAHGANNQDDEMDKAASQATELVASLLANTANGTPTAACDVAGLRALRRSGLSVTEAYRRTA